MSESTPTMHTGSLTGKRDTRRKDGGARNILQVEIRDMDDCAVWLTAEPEHGGGWFVVGLREGRATTLASAVSCAIEGAGVITRKPYTVTLTDIDGECHEGKVVPCPAQIVHDDWRARITA